MYPTRTLILLEQYGVKSPIIKNKSKPNCIPCVTDRGGGVVGSSQNVDSELLLDSVVGSIQAVVVLVPGDDCKHDDQSDCSLHTAPTEIIPHSRLS